MTRNTLTNGLRNAILAFLLLIPYNLLAFAVTMYISEGGVTPWIAVPATIIGLGALFLGGRFLLRELPSAIGTLLSLLALPLLYMGTGALLCGEDFWYGIYPSFFLSSASIPISVFLNWDAPSVLRILSYIFGALLPFAALYVGIQFRPIEKQPTEDSSAKENLKNSAVSFFSWLIAEAICGALYFCGIYQLVAQGDSFEIILGLLFSVVLSLVPYVVPLIFGRYCSTLTKNAATDALACCIPFLLLAAVRLFGSLFVWAVPTAQNNDASIFFQLSPTTFGFIYFIEPFLPGSEVVGGTMQTVVPDAVYGILPALLPPIAYFIGMQMKRKREKGREKSV